MFKKLGIAVLAAGAVLVALSAPAAACNAPPGLSLYEYEARCRIVLMQLHRMQAQRSPYGVTLPYLHYVQSWYGMYLRRTQNGG